MRRSCRAGLSAVELMNFASSLKARSRPRRPRLREVAEPVARVDDEGLDFFALDFLRVETR